MSMGVMRGMVVMILQILTTMHMMMMARRKKRRRQRETGDAGDSAAVMAADVRLMGYGDESEGERPWNWKR